MCLVWASSGGWVRVSDFKVVVKCRDGRKKSEGIPSPNHSKVRAPLSLGGLLMPAGGSGFQEVCIIPTKYSSGSPAARPPSKPSWAELFILWTFGSCLLDEAQPPRAAGWIGFCEGREARCKRATGCSGQFGGAAVVKGFSKSGETQGWRTKNGEDQEPGAPGPVPAPDERRPNP